jgi:predicted alpha/beta-hydrolase family hydrolase
MLLMPPVAVKLASTGWRMLRYYLRGEDYVQRGPPHAALRVLVAPVLVASTLVLFATGVALLVLGQSHGTVVGLHKAAFVVWVGAAGVHVLVHVPKLRRALSQRIP